MRYRIEERAGKWVVIPEDGGTPVAECASRAEAEAKLSATSGSLHHSELVGEKRVPVVFGRMQRFDAADTEGLVRVGTWDRWATWGEKVKDGSETVFDELTLGQMIENWYARAGRCPLCLDHQSTLGGLVRAPAAGYYDAFAIVHEGKVLLYRALAGSTSTSPDPAALAARVQRFATEANPNPVPDGGWAWRCEVTPLGRDPKEGLANYQGLSPFFTPKGEDEKGQPIGYVLFDIAAVNVQFQAGCELTLGVFSGALGDARPTGAARAPGGSMNPEMLKRLSLDPGATTEQVTGALKKFSEDMRAKMARAMDGIAAAADEAGEKPHLEEIRKMAAEADAMAKFDGAGAEAYKGSFDELRRMSKQMKRFAGAPAAAPEPDKAEAEAMSALAAKLNLSAGAGRKEIFMAATAGMVSLAQVGSIVDERLKTAREKDAAELAERTRTEKAEELATVAVRCGYEEKDRPHLVALAKTSYDTALGIVKKLPGFEALSVITVGGSPLGKPASSPLDLSAAPDVNVEVEATKAINAIAQRDKTSFSVAMGKLKLEKPDLYKAYLQQHR